jgi:3-dehydroquinate synthetase
MMTIHLSLNNRAIPIIIGKNILGHLGRLIKKTSLGTDAIIITMPGIKNRFGKNLEDLLKKTCRSVAILTIPAKTRSSRSASSIKSREWTKIKRFFCWPWEEAW